MDDLIKHLKEKNFAEVRKWVVNNNEKNTIGQYNREFNEEENWFLFMNDGFCPLDENEYPVDFNDIILSKKYHMWKYQVYMYKVLLETINISHHNNSSTDKVLLDIACGRGGGLSFYKDYYKFKKLIGVDLNPNHINFAKNHLNNVDLFTSSALNTPVESSTIDIATCVEASGYFNTINFIEELRRIIKPGGIYVRTSRDIEDEKLLIDNGFEKIKCLSIHKNARISCAIGKWRFFEKSLKVASMFSSDEGLYVHRDYFYNITAFKKI